jgi:transcriptional regulator with XRE-family HTH domain
VVLLGGTFEERLNALFETVHPPDRGPYSNHEVADMLRERVGVSVSQVYLWQLRTGRRDNPTRRHLEALATFFGVPVAYFFDDGTADRVMAELAFARRLHENGVQRFAMRVAGLSPQSMEQVLATVEQLRAQEGLPASSADEGTDGHP